MVTDFPAAWRYVPLRLDPRRQAWINAIPYRSNENLRALGEFHGVDVNGTAHFGTDNTVTDIPFLKGGVPELATRDGYAVGIFMRDSYPGLVIVDCDSETEAVVSGGEATFKTRYGRDELLAIFKKRGEPVPRCPAVRGNRQGHGYLIFRQNPRAQVRTRKIKPRGAAFDVLGTGYQVHWTCGNRALVAGEDLLDEPPELPAWFASLVTGARDEGGTSGLGGMRSAAGGQLGELLVEAVLRPVTPSGPAWNQRLFNAACTLAESGVSWDRLVALIVARCRPETEADERAALDSIASAWRKTTGEAVPE